MNVVDETGSPFAEQIGASERSSQERIVVATQNLSSVLDIETVDAAEIIARLKVGGGDATALMERVRNSLLVEEEKRRILNELSNRGTKTGALHLPEKRVTPTIASATSDIISPVNKGAGPERPIIDVDAVDTQKSGVSRFGPHTSPTFSVLDQDGHLPKPEERVSPPFIPGVSEKIPDVEVKPTSVASASTNGEELSDVDALWDQVSERRAQTGTGMLRHTMGLRGATGKIFGHAGQVSSSTQTNEK